MPQRQPRPVGAQGLELVPPAAGRLEVPRLVGGRQLALQDARQLLVGLAGAGLGRDPQPRLPLVDVTLLEQGGAQRHRGTQVTEVGGTPSRPSASSAGPGPSGAGRGRAPRRGRRRPRSSQHRLRLVGLVVPEQQGDLAGGAGVSPVRGHAVGLERLRGAPAASWSSPSRPAGSVHPCSGSG